jgi:segregation and condensation protein B
MLACLADDHRSPDLAAISQPLPYNVGMTDTEQAVHDDVTEQAHPTQEAESAEPADAEGEAEDSMADESKAPEPKLTRKQADELALKVEAALLTTDRPMTAGKLSDLLGEVGTKAIIDAAEQLNTVYEKSGRSFRIEKVAGGLQVLTLPMYADILSELHKSRAQTRLSPAAMETLAIVAYQQPIMRAQIESIRGVACGEVLRSLMERHMVKIVGRAEEIGRPMLYGTTKGFLEVFGLSGIKDLPKVEKSKIPHL